MESAHRFFWAAIAGVGLVSCATPPVRVVARGACADAPPDEAVLFCDERGRLVTCAGGTALPAAEEISACVTLEGAPFLVTCEANQGPGLAELVPCPACAAFGERPSFVTLSEQTCLLEAGARPELPEEPLEEEPLEPEPTDEGLELPPEDDPLDEDAPLEPLDEPAPEDEADAGEEDAPDFTFEPGDLDAHPEDEIPDDEEPPPAEE